MSQHEPEADAAEQEAVRRLLADARHREPVPPDVIARLQAVLVGLAAEGRGAVDRPPPAPPLAPVVDLAARRRRRVTRLLVAAAAVAVLGVGVGQVVGTVDSGDDQGTPAAGGESDVEVAEAAPEAAAPSAAEEAPGAVEDETRSTGEDSAPPALVTQVGVRTFPSAVLRLRDDPSVLSTRGLRLSGDELTSAPMFECPATSWGEGRLLAVRYDGLPAVLAYRPAAGDTQTVELLQCGSGEVLRSTVIPFP